MEHNLFVALMDIQKSSFTELLLKRTRKHILNNAISCVICVIKNISAQPFT